MLIYCRDICFKSCCKYKEKPQTLKYAYYPKGLGNKKVFKLNSIKETFLNTLLGGVGEIRLYERSEYIFERAIFFYKYIAS